MQALLLGMILATPQADGLETKIAVMDAMGRPVDEVANQLGKTSGLVMVAASGIGREPVMMHLEDKTVQQIMDELAYVCDGKWSEKNGAWTLAANTVQTEANTAEVAAVEKALAERKDVVWGADSAKSYVQKVNEGREKMKGNVRVGGDEQAFLHTEGNGLDEMGGQILTAAMRQLGARTLAGVAVGQRKVWSTNPNQRQIAFPGNLNQAIQGYRQVVNDVINEAKKNPPGDYGFGWSGDFGIPKEADANIAKVNVIAYRSNATIMVGVQLVGSGGEELLMVSDQLPVVPIEDKVEQPTESSVIPLSSASLQLVAINANGRSGGGMSMMMMNGDDVVRLETGRVARNYKLDDGLKKILDNPAKVDFLNLFVGESIHAVYPESEFVAVVPDQLWSELFQASKTADLRESEAKAAFVKWTMSSMNAGVRRVRAKDSEAARRTRINRGELGALIAKTNSNGYAKLQDGASYIRTRGYVVDNQDPDAILLSAGQPFLAELLTRTLGNQYQSSVLLSMAPDLMSVNPGKDLKWEFSQMNNGMKTALESLIFNQPLGTTLGGITSSISVNTEPLPPRRASDNEATELYVNGIPANFALTFSIKEEQGVLGRVRGQQTGRMLTAMDFGAIYGFIESQGGGQGEYALTQFEEYLSSMVRGITINMPGSSINYTDGRVDVGAKAEPYSNLDKSFIERGQFARKAMQEAGKNMRGNQNQAPPPK
ncbi:MAG: hypothetical protein ACKVQS_09140 [Fimbriimonadaceae bacterium]